MEKNVAFQRNTLWNNLRALCKQCTRPENLIFQSAFQKLKKHAETRTYISLQKSYFKKYVFCQFGDCTPFPYNATQVDLCEKYTANVRSMVAPSTNPGTALSLRSLRLHASWSLSMGERRGRRRRRKKKGLLHLWRRNPAVIRYTYHRR